MAFNTLHNTDTSALPSLKKATGALRATLYTTHSRSEALDVHISLSTELTAFTRASNLENSWKVKNRDAALDVVAPVRSVN